MGNIMNEIADVLQDLADQLGTSVEYLWPLMVKQTQIDYVGFVLFCIVMSAIALYIDRKIPRPDGWFEECDVNPAHLAGFIARVASILFPVVALALLAQVSTFLVPEAATIERLLDMVK